MYIYLPMRTPSPLHAHLHAPFHTKMARLDLTQQSIFNTFLVRAAAQLAAATINVLVSGRADLDVRTRQGAAIDLHARRRPCPPQFVTAMSK